MARNPKRNRATANEPTVKAVRNFFRDRFAKIRWKEFHARLPTCARFHQHAFVKVESCIGTFRGHGVVRHHQDGLVVFLAEALQEFKYFISTLAVEVAGRLVAQKKGGIGDDSAGDGDALFLSAGELARVMVHAVGEADDA